MQPVYKDQHVLDINLYNLYTKHQHIIYYLV